MPKFNIKNVQVVDFFDELPKPNFTLAEWVNFVNTHPHYLRVTEDYSSKIVNSVHKGLENIQAFTKPLEILQNRLARSEIIKFQKKELENIYLKC